MSKYEEEDLGRIRPIPIGERRSKIRVDDFPDPTSLGLLGRENLPRVERLFPDLLAGRALKEIASALLRARKEGREVLWLVGAHVIKCGLSLYLNDLIRGGWISSIAATGSSAVHDLELAFFGATSEDVAEELPQGRFGMAQETAEHFLRAVSREGLDSPGLGESLGKYIGDSDPPHSRYSVLATAWEASVPFTVHVAMGTDIVHQHPGFPAGKVGEATMRDFRILTHRIGKLFDRGVVLLWGSAVVLPEVFLKAVSINYNLGRKPTGVTAAVFDMKRQYRPEENVLSRPFPKDCAKYEITGHHEITLPLLYLLLSSWSG